MVLCQTVQDLHAITGFDADSHRNSLESSVSNCQHDAIHTAANQRFTRNVHAFFRLLTTNTDASKHPRFQSDTRILQTNTDLQASRLWIQFRINVVDLGGPCLSWHVFEFKTDRLIRFDSSAVALEHLCNDPDVIQGGEAHNFSTGPDEHAFAHIQRGHNASHGSGNFNGTLNTPASTQLANLVLRHSQ